MRRTITRLAIVATAVCSIVLISFPSFPSTLGIVFKPQLVDRALKGDSANQYPGINRKWAQVATGARADGKTGAHGLRSRF